MDINAAIDNLPPLRDIITQNNLTAQKSLGQNFLLDLNITEKIARQAGNLKDAHIFEIGPGPGGLTRALLKTEARQVTAIEFDERAVKALESLKQASAGKLDIIQGDALDYDLISLAQAPRAIVANLPYNIATPLMIGWLKQIRQDENAYRSITVMVQKEVAQRLIAKPNTKAYGRLSVIAGWLCDIKIVYDLPPSAFTPPPKVKSSVVRFQPKHIERSTAPSFKAVEKITAAAFGQRRKMIRSSLSEYEQYFQRCNLNPKNRAENLSIQDFINLAYTAE